MDFALTIALAITSISLLAWIWLIYGRGLFWRMDQILRPASADDGNQYETGRSAWPTVRIIVPARNEADNLPATLSSLFKQDYPGPLTILLVDDQSTDGTGELAISLGQEQNAGKRLRVVAGETVPSGWTGKLWALEQGVRADREGQENVQVEGEPRDLYLFTDADIIHPPDSLRTLVTKAIKDELDMVSVMAHLQVSTAWEHLLIPAFVYFFAKLYPFRWVSNPNRNTAAAAGGCVLLRRGALARAGGLESISGRIIDDCALADLIKKSRRPDSGGIWLGLDHNVRSTRSNGGLEDIWRMVTRLAYAQLHNSPVMLAVTVLGLSLVYLVPVGGVIGGLVAGVIDQDSTLALWLLVAGLLAWILMAGSYLPTLKHYRLSPVLAFTLPLAAALYTLMTIDSARRSRQGQGANWKGRVYR